MHGKSILFYVLCQWSIDLFVFIRAVCETMARSSSSHHMKTYEIGMTIAVVMLPLVFFGLAGISQHLYPIKRGIECFEALPIEHILDPIVNGICLIGSFMCLLVCLSQRSLNDFL